MRHRCTNVRVHFKLLRHALDIIDKHGSLITTGLYAAVSSPGSPLNISAATWQSLEKDVVIQRWLVGEPEPDVTYALTIFFDEPPAPKHEPILAVLNNMRETVHFVVSEAAATFGL